MAQSIIFEKTLKIAQKKLHMILQKQQGDYNQETSIYIGMINPFCTENDIIEELNLVLRDDRIKKEKEEANLNRNKNGSANQEAKKDEKIPVKTDSTTKNFILSRMVFYDPVS